MRNNKLNTEDKHKEAQSALSRLANQVQMQGGPRGSNRDSYLPCLYLQKNYAWPRYATYKVHTNGTRGPARQHPQSTEVDCCAVYKKSREPCTGDNRIRVLEVHAVDEPLGAPRVSARTLGNMRQTVARVTTTESSAATLLVTLQRGPPVTQ